MASFAQLKADILAHYKTHIATINAGATQVPERLVVADRSEPVETPFVKIVLEPQREFALAGRKPVKAKVQAQIYFGVGGYTNLSEAEDAAMELAGLGLVVALRFKEFRALSAPLWDAHYSSFSVAYIEAEAFYDPATDAPATPPQEEA